MYVTKSIRADHEDLIHDVAYDFYGRRMATCSSDQLVKVWDQDDGGSWVCSASWKTHYGSVWKVTWAHPEFGQVLATCSFDRTAAVWEEIAGEKSSGGQNHWVRRTSLVDSRTSVTDVKFGPKHLGLILATCSADGTVRIYEAPDVMNLSQWSLQHEIPCKLPCSCISWNPSLSRLHNPMIAVGSDDTSTGTAALPPQGKVSVYEFSETARRWQRVETFIRITEPVHDIAFAPNIGRSYHVLAVASKDLLIFTLKPLSSGGGGLPPSLASAGTVGSLMGSTTTTAASGGGGSLVPAGTEESAKFEIRQAGQFDDHGSSVWRVCWNITGTILASSGDDGQVKLWKANYLDNWKCVSTLRCDGQAEPAAKGELDLGKAGFTRIPGQQLGHQTVHANWH